MPKVAAFRKAVEATEQLEFRVGLSAIKRGEGKGRIVPNDAKRLLGSADIDKDCERAYPNDARWDYVIGYARSQKAIAYFVEVHSAETSDVSKMEAKLQWLLGYLQGESQCELASLKREIHWVASGPVKILRHTPQFRKLSTTLRKRGLQGPVKSLLLL